MKAIRHGGQQTWSLSRRRGISRDIRALLRRSFLMGRGNRGAFLCVYLGVRGDRKFSITFPRTDFVISPPEASRLGETPGHKLSSSCTFHRLNGAVK